MELTNGRVYQLEATLYAENQIILTPKQKEELLKVVEDVGRKDIPSNVRRYYALSKKDNIYIEFNKSYNGVYCYIREGLDQVENIDFNKIYAEGIAYDSYEDMTDNKFIKFFKGHFDSSSNSKNLTNETPLKELLKTSTYKCDENRYEAPSEIYQFFHKKINAEDRNKMHDNLYLLKEILKSHETEIFIVSKVMEYDGTRYVFLCNRNKSILYIGKPVASLYDYMDEGRVILFNNIDSWRYAEDFIAFDVIEDMKTFDVLIKQYASFYKRISRNNRHNQYMGRLINNKDVLTDTNKYKLREMKVERQEAIAKKKNEKYAKDMKNMNKIPLIKNGISFTEFTMEYQEVVADFSGVFSFKEYLGNIGVDAIADFNTILNCALKTIGLYFVEYDVPYKFIDGTRSSALVSRIAFARQKSVIFTVDNKDVVLTKDTSLDVTKYKINDIRINKFEVFEVLTHVLCHPTIDAYKKFLTNVSKCSMKFHKAISQNIKKTFRAHGDSSNVELKMERDGNKNQLIIGKKKFNISNTNKLIDSKPYSFVEFVSLILEVTDATINDMKPIVSDGIKRYVQALAKSKELLANTLKKFDVKKENHDGKTGYVVTGKSGTRYLIEDKSSERHGGNFKTWVIKASGELDYRCIVDKTSAGQVGKDALVSRIFGLANDTLIAKNISTIRGDV